jgi:hypothetical protein
MHSIRVRVDDDPTRIACVHIQSLAAVDNVIPNLQAFANEWTTIEQTPFNFLPNPVVVHNASHVQDLNTLHHVNNHPCNTCRTGVPERGRVNCVARTIPRYEIRRTV